MNPRMIKYLTTVLDFQLEFDIFPDMIFINIAGQPGHFKLLMEGFQMVFGRESRQTEIDLEMTRRAQQQMIRTNTIIPQEDISVRPLFPEDNHRNRQDRLSTDNRYDYDDRSQRNNRSHRDRSPNRTHPHPLSNTTTNPAIQSITA